MHYSGNPRHTHSIIAYDFDSVFLKNPMKNCVVELLLSCLITIELGILERFPATTLPFIFLYKTLNHFLFVLHTDSQNIISLEESGQQDRNSRHQRGKWLPLLHSWCKTGNDYHYHYVAVDLIIIKSMYETNRTWNEVWGVKCDLMS